MITVNGVQLGSVPASGGTFTGLVSFNAGITVKGTLTTKDENGTSVLVVDDLAAAGNRKLTLQDEGGNPFVRIFTHSLVRDFALSDELGATFFQAIGKTSNRIFATYDSASVTMQVQTTLLATRTIQDFDEAGVQTRLATLLAASKSYVYGTSGASAKLKIDLVTKQLVALGADGTTTKASLDFASGAVVAPSVTGVTTLALNGTTVALQSSSTTAALLESTSSLQIGTGDGTSAPGNFTIRGANNVAGQNNAAGGSVTYATGLSTGSSRGALHVWKSGTVLGSGTTLQTLAETMRLWPSGAIDVSLGGIDSQVPGFVLPTNGVVYVNNAGVLYTIVSGLASAMTFGHAGYNAVIQGFSLQVLAAGTSLALGAISAITMNIGGVTKGQIDSTGHMSINTASAPATSAALDVGGTDGSILFPRMTTTQKNALTAAEGMVVYDTTLHKLSVRTAATWETVTST